MRVLADGRVRRSEAEWRGLLERFSKSGLSISAFCRRMKRNRSACAVLARRKGGSIRREGRRVAVSAHEDPLVSADDLARILPGGAVDAIGLGPPMFRQRPRPSVPAATKLLPEGAQVLGPGVARSRRKPLIRKEDRVEPTAGFEPATC